MSTVPWMAEFYLINNIRGHEVTYRSDMISLNKQAYYDFTYRNMWEDPDNVASQWLQERVFLPAVLKDSFVILQFYGMSNSGKSWLALAKAMQLKMLLEAKYDREIHIHHAVNWSEALELLQTIPEGDIIIVDEETDLSGEDSDVEAEAMSNVLRSCRILGKHLFFCDPQPTPKPNVDAYIRVAAICEDLFLTISITYDPEDSLIGLDFTTIPVTDEYFVKWIPKYDKKKKDNAIALIAARGRAGVDLNEQRWRDADAVLPLAFENIANGHKPTLDNIDLWIDQARIVGSVKYITKLRTLLKAEIKDHSGPRPISDRMHDETFDVEWRFYTDSRQRKLDESEVKAVLPFFKQRCKKIGITGEKFNIFKYYLLYQGNQTQVAKKLKISDSKVSKILKGSDTTEGILKTIGDKVTGYATEDWVAKKHMGWIHGGENTPEPDFIDHEGKKVWSCKGMVRKEGWRTHTWQDLAESERRLCIEDEYELSFLQINWLRRQEREVICQYEQYEDEDQKDDE